MKAKNVDEYISSHPKEIAAELKKMRRIIREAAPGAEEVISYGMPGYKLNGMLVWFAAAKKHIGFYPTASPIPVFREKLKKYKTSKGAIQFPYDEEIPLALVKAIVKFKLKENQAKAKALSKKK